MSQQGFSELINLNSIFTYTAIHQNWLWDNSVAAVIHPAASRIEWYGQVWQGLHYTWDIEGVIDAFLDVLSGGVFLMPVIPKLLAIHP